MAKERNIGNKDDKEREKQGSGTQYHKEHANHVPDYGGNTKDPNATSRNQMS